MVKFVVPAEGAGKPEEAFGGVQFETREGKVAYAMGRDASLPARAREVDLSELTYPSGFTAHLLEQNGHFKRGQ